MEFSAQSLLQSSASALNIQIMEQLLNNLPLQPTSSVSCASFVASTMLFVTMVMDWISIVYQLGPAVCEETEDLVEGLQNIVKFTLKNIAWVAHSSNYEEYAQYNMVDIDSLLSHMILML